MKKIELNDFINAVQLGQEIEFNIKGHKFFLQPLYNDCNFQKQGSAPKFIIYDCKNLDQPYKLISGTMEEILNYVFLDGITLNRQFQYFNIECIF